MTDTSPPTGVANVMETATALEVPMGTVRSRLSRARPRLAALVGPISEDPS